jgi:RNA polymerase sigma factor (TIGR02999 family)
MGWSTPVVPEGANSREEAPMSDVTCILSAIEHGEPHAAEQLLPMVYDELRRLAQRKMASEPTGQTLQPTALVHEAYIRLVDAPDEPNWDSRTHFFAAAAEAMRRILVESARRKASLRRGGDRRRFELLDADRLAYPAGDELLDLDEALSKLSDLDAQAGELVKLRVFAGMTIEEVAQHLRISPRTAKRSWAYARAWLGRELATYGNASE